MKPSDQILRRRNALVEQRKQGDPWFDRHIWRHEIEARIQAIMEHLDEQHEIERRRTYLHAALAACSYVELPRPTPGYPVQEDVERFAKLAGLAVNVLFDDTRQDLVRRLLDHAEREGLI